ncbi:MAG TPA: alpha-ketoglutarate-dependent dioxygenase AlkB [Solirubrobacteraceae bacterium]
MTTQLEPPQGISLRREVVTRDEERELLERFDALRWKQVETGDQATRRTARHFGLGYDYELRSARPDEPIPSWLEPIRRVAAALAGLQPDELVEILLQRYPVGATIAWHRDSPAFGVVVGISLLSRAMLRLRPLGGDPGRVLEIELDPRSGYVLSCESRFSWEHSVPPTAEPRYSITLRTFREDWHRSQVPNPQQHGEAASAAPTR